MSLALVTFIYFFYTASWLNNSNRFNDLKEYVESDYNNEIIRTLFFARMHLKDVELYKELGLKGTFVYAYVTEEGGHYWLSFKEDGMVFSIQFSDNGIIYSYEKHEIEDVDDRNKVKTEKTYYPLDVSLFESLDFKSIIIKVLDIYKSIKK